VNRMEPQSTADAPAAASARPPSLDDVVHRIVGEIEHDRMSPGEVAELRRLEPGRPPGAAFWKCLAFHVEPAGQLPTGDGEARWQLILRAVGELHSLHRRGRRLGRALAAAKVSEMRLARLLRADLDGLGASLRAVSHQLASAGERVDLADLARLVVTARRGKPKRREGAVRQHIALDFYRGLRKAAASPSDSNQEARS
jgi:CRISPR system Cascade subunit CasB